jgi:entericidin B
MQVLPNAGAGYTGLQDLRGDPAGSRVAAGRVREWHGACGGTDGRIGRCAAPPPELNHDERRAMWKKALFVLMSLASLALTACNTMQGAGRDVEHAGQKLQEEAQEHKHY